MSSNFKIHPRRTTADRSVSLRHSPRAQLQYQQRQKCQSDSSSNESARIAAQTRDVRSHSNGTSPASLNALAGKHSSGESSNAEKWFEKSNNEVAEASKSFADNDPPFFMRNYSSSDDQLDGQRSRQYLSPNGLASDLQMRAGLLRLGTDGSSTDDFRGVIDDLTIENKKLKRRLKKYEKLHDSHLKDEKLFEVRIHGLPPDKKRELEETLRKFATALSDTKGETGFPPNGYLGLPSTLTGHKTASSSNSLQNDSAYASMSASGQGSAGGESMHRKFAQTAKSRHQDIHSYLHHIPEDLLPQQNPQNMSERAKKKLVVRRLEQIFAGTGAALSGHQQALQQQDVSHSAAHADRIEREAQGKLSGKEGIREASIMDDSAIESDLQTSHPAAIAVSGFSPSADQPSSNTAISAGSVQMSSAKHPDQRNTEQRPTRPLDLDPSRAQVPEDNLRYFRHLGFELPDPQIGSPLDDEGWIYLNLLISMAQLHTISVTGDFVRKAIGDISDKLELSSDGRKVRWKGGSSMTRTSSTGGESIISRTDNDNSLSPRKRVKLSVDPNQPEKKRPSRYIPGSRAPQSESNRFAYTPLFFHKESTSDDDSSSELDEDDDTSSPFPRPLGGDSSGMTSSAIRTSSNKQQKKHDDGPIIFYNNARFCTDLSGDVRSALSPGAPLYKPASVAPIGMPETTVGNKYYERPDQHYEGRGPLADADMLPEPMSLNDNPIPESMELKFPTTSPISEAVAPQTPFDFEVTGIGGVYPADHFAIAVDCRHVTIESESATSAVQHPKALPPHLAQLLKTTKTESATGKRKITTRRKDMPPSALPPALSYMLTGSDSFSDDGSDAEDGMSIVPDSPGAMPSLAAPQQLDLPYGYLEDSDADMESAEDAEAEDDDDAESDGSLDLLATARELDPEAVRAREREYDANMAERLAEEIPAGSSAATAGGGSGFASPASGVSRSMYHRAIIEARAMARRKPDATDSTMNMQDDSSDESEAGSIRS